MGSDELRILGLVVPSPGKQNNMIYLEQGSKRTKAGGAEKRGRDSIDYKMPFIWVTFACYYSKFVAYF